MSNRSAYFKELIPLHERTHPGRGIGNGVLAGYYDGLANAYAGLQKTPEAVEAAGGAIVAWGGRRDQRTQALATMKQVLLRSPDLGAFVAHFDQQKQDSAIVRKALGEAYREKGEHAKAIKQLELAAALQPGDADIYQLLVASYDQLGDKAGGLRQLLQAVQLARRDTNLYQQLGERYATEGQPKEAERAYTSIVEMLPAEAESHAQLAEVREKQNRWSDAMAHWEQAVHRLRAALEADRSSLEIGRRPNPREAMGPGPEDIAQTRCAELAAALRRCTSPNTHTGGDGDEAVKVLRTPFPAGQ